MGNTVNSTSVSRVNENERPSGSVLVATEDVYVDAVDANGRPLRHGQTFVAAKGNRIPDAYLGDESVTAKAITASEFDAKVANGEIVLGSPFGVADALEVEDDEDGDDVVPISRLTVDQAKAELDAAGEDYDPDAKRDDLRDLVAALRGE